MANCHRSRLSSARPREGNSRARLWVVLRSIGPSERYRRPPSPTEDGARSRSCSVVPATSSPAAHWPSTPRWAAAWPREDAHEPSGRTSRFDPRSHPPQSGRAQNASRSGGARGCARLSAAKSPRWAHERSGRRRNCHDDLQSRRHQPDCFRHSSRWVPASASLL
jgi:hypothetical protein